MDNRHTPVMEQVLSLSARPRSLDGLVGQDQIVRSIRARWKKQRLPKAFLFSGPLGTGKTSICRILGLSLQCQHQNGIFGKPCQPCRTTKGRYLITEVNTAQLKIENIRDSLAEAYLSPMGASNYRVYIIDEPQGMSKQAQQLMLKFLEDTPPSTVFLLATTEPHALLDTLRSRCSAYEMRGLDTDQITAYVARLLKKVGSDLPADRLVDVLVDRGLKYPRWIAQAVETYVVDEGALDNVGKVDAAETIDVTALTRAITKGDWLDAAAYLYKAQASDARPIRLSLIKYLRAILLESTDMADRTKAVATAIRILAALQFSEQSVVAAAVAAEVYNLCEVFSEFKR